MVSDKLTTDYLHFTKADMYRNTDRPSKTGYEVGTDCSLSVEDGE